LNKIGLSDRFELYTASPRCVGDFDQKLDEFIDKVSSLSHSKMEAKPSV